MCMYALYAWDGHVKRPPARTRRHLHACIRWQACSRVGMRQATGSTIQLRRMQDGALAGRMNLPWQGGHGELETGEHCSGGHHQHAAAVQWEWRHRCYSKRKNLGHAIMR